MEDSKEREEAFVDGEERMGEPERTITMRIASLLSQMDRELAKGKGTKKK